MTNGLEASFNVGLLVLAGVVLVLLLPSMYQDGRDAIRREGLGSILKVIAISIIVSVAFFGVLTAIGRVVLFITEVLV